MFNEKNKNKNDGYVGYSMSNRAAAAYRDGERPLSKWTKEDIIWKIGRLQKWEGLELNFEINTLKKLTKSELIYHLMDCCGWHHTGANCQRTLFFDLDLEKISKLTNERIFEIIAERQPKVKKVKKEPLFITALVEFSNWEGSRSYPKKVYYKEVVHFRENDKMVRTSKGSKRLSNVRIIEKKEDVKDFPKLENK